MKRAFMRSLLPLLVIALSTACSGGSGNPAEPSPAADGATISGVVTGPAVQAGGASMLSGPAATAGAGLTVSVAGTGISAPADATGRFTLTGVPAGDLELVFAGAGVNARLSLAVREREQVTLRVTVNGSTAILNGEERLYSGKLEIEGKISDVNPEDTTDTIVVNGLRIHVPPGTTIRHGDMQYLFDDLRAGDRVHVRATQGTDGLVAELVLLQNPAPDGIEDPEDPEDPDETEDPDDKVELEGRISALEPEGAGTLLVDGKLVSVPSDATIRRGETPIGFDDLKVGDRVHVRGHLEATMIVAELVILQNDNPTVPVNVKGIVTSVATGAACPAIEFVVQGWTIEAGAGTDFRKAPCSSIAAGVSVHVFGHVDQETGHVVAVWIQVG